MSRALPTLLLALCFCTAAFAIVPGNTEKEVLATLGKPNVTRTTPTGSIWKFKDGTSVRFENGVVKEVDGPGAARDVQGAATHNPAAIPIELAVPAPAPADKLPATAPAAVVAAKPGPDSKTVSLPVSREEAEHEPPPPKPTWTHYSALGLTVLGSLAMLGANIWLTVVAFRLHLGWAIAVFLLPAIAIRFMIRHWDEETKKICVIYVAGVAITAGGVALGG